MSNTDGEVEDRHWERFDRLPQPFRLLLMYASHSYQLWWIEDAIRRKGPEGAYRWVVRELADLRRDTVLEAYGRTHPQWAR